MISIEGMVIYANEDIPSKYFRMANRATYDRKRFFATEVFYEFLGVLEEKGLLIDDEPDYHDLYDEVMFQIRLRNQEYYTDIRRTLEAHARITTQVQTQAFYKEDLMIHIREEHEKNKKAAIFFYLQKRFKDPLFSRYIFESIYA